MRSIGLSGCQLLCLHLTFCGFKWMSCCRLDSSSVVPRPPSVLVEITPRHSYRLLTQRDLINHRAIEILASLGCHPFGREFGPICICGDLFVPLRMPFGCSYTMCCQPSFVLQILG